MTIRSAEKMRVALETIADLKGRVERLEYTVNAGDYSSARAVATTPTMTFPLSTLKEDDIPQLYQPGSPTSPPWDTRDAPHRGPGRPRKVVE